jgi:membrane protease YdiL (CAAX protease family)
VTDAPDMTNGEPASISASDVAAAPAEPPHLTARGALWIFVACLLAQLVLAVPLAVLVGTVAALWPHAPPLDVLRRALAIPVTILGTIASGVTALQLTRRRLPGRLSEGALASVGWSRPSAASVRHALGLGLGLVVLFPLVNHVLPAGHGPTGPLANASHEGPWARLSYVVLALLVAPPVEELVFRGVLFAGLSRRLGTFKAGALVTLLFVVPHAPETRGNLLALAVIGALGVAALQLRIRTGSLVPPVILHTSYNLALVLATYTASL